MHNNQLTKTGKNMKKHEKLTRMETLKICVKNIIRKYLKNSEIS